MLFYTEYVGALSIIAMYVCRVHMYCTYLHVRVIGPLLMLRGSTIMRGRHVPLKKKKANKTVIPVINILYTYIHCNLVTYTWMSYWRSYHIILILVVAGHVPVLSIFSYQEKNLFYNYYYCTYIQWVYVRTYCMYMCTIIGKAGITSKLL